MRDRLQKLEVFQGDMLRDRGMFVIPVNCVPGVMGAGLAKEFADICPRARERHRRAVSGTGLRIGRPVILYGLTYNPVIYFPTKKHWRSPAKTEWISSGLLSLAEILGRKDKEDIQCQAIIMPALGCGLGGLKYADVYPLIANFAYSLPEPYHVRLYRPHNSNE